VKNEEAGEDWVMRCLMICILYRVFIRLIKIMRMRLVGHVACMGQKRNAYRISMGKYEGKGSL